GDTFYLGENYPESLPRLCRASPAFEQKFRAAPYYPHRCPDFVGEARRQGSDRSEAVGTLQSAIELQFITMAFKQVDMRFCEPLIESLKFFAQQLHLIVRQRFA